MISEGVNNIIDNICDKLGTSAKLLVPEMRGFMIARNSIWIVVSLFFLIICAACITKMIKMHHEDNKIHQLYDTAVKALKEGSISERELKHDYWVVQYDEDNYIPYILISVITGVIGVPLLAQGVTQIIGWALSPNAMAVMWIVAQIGGK